MTRNKKLLIVLLALAVLTGGYFLYMAWAFLRSAARRQSIWILRRWRATATPAT